MKEKRKKKEIVTAILKSRYTIVSVLTILISMLTMLLFKIVPFGENTVLKNDLFTQYVNFFCYFKDCLEQGKSILFSWNLGLGNNFFTTFAYYLASPFNLLVLFFSKENMYLCIQCILLLKAIAIASSMTFYLSKILHCTKKESILFALSYTFCAFAVSIYFHVMWLDAMYMLPLVLVMVDRYISTNKIGGYIGVLAITLLIHYYTGFMVAFFSGLYYLAKWILAHSVKEEKKEYGKKGAKQLAKFLLGIVLAFGISAVVLLPCLIQSKDGISIGNSTPLLQIDASKLSLFTNIFFNTYSHGASDRIGHLFCGTLTIVLLPIYYANKRISKKEKVVYTILLLFLLLPVVSPLLDRIWYAMSIPNGFVYRYSFITSFVMVSMAARVYQERAGIKKVHVLISTLFLLGIILLEFLLANYSDFLVAYIGIKDWEIIVSAISVLLFGVLLLLAITCNKKQNIIYVLLLLCTLLDSMIGIYGTKDFLGGNYTTEEYHEHDQTVAEILPSLENRQIDRIAFLGDTRTNNLSMRYGYSNIGFFTSSRNKDTIQHMCELGYNIHRNIQLWISSNSGTYFNYSLARVCHYLTKEKQEKYGFTLVDTIENTYYLYENNNLLPFGTYLRNNVTVGNKNAFELQNELLSNMGPEKEYFINIDKENELVTTESSQKRKGELEERSYTVTAKKETTLYLCGDAIWQLYKEGVPWFKNYHRIDSEENGIQQIVHLEPGETYSFSIEVTPNSKEVYLYASDDAKITQTIRKANETKVFSLQEIEVREITGTISSKEAGYLFLPISYDKGWKANIDGNRQEIEAVAGAFLGVPIPEGTHNITLTYTPEGFTMGIVISVVSLLFTVIICGIEKREDK